MEKVSLSIDGKRVDCAAGTTLLRVAEAHAIKIPTLCDHPDLKPFGACRMCLVEDEKTGRLLASCVTPAAQDMAIRTDSERIKQHRRNIVFAAAGGSYNNFFDAGNASRHRTHQERAGVWGCAARRVYTHSLQRKNSLA